MRHFDHMQRTTQTYQSKLSQNSNYCKRSEERRVNAFLFLKLFNTDNISLLLLGIISLIITMNQNILEDSCESSSIAIGRTKINFLEEEKVRLEYIVREMEEQVRLQKHINHQIVQGAKIAEGELVNNLIRQNEVLSEQYLRIKAENQELTSNILIQQQLMDENQLEFGASFKSYEQKIIELRRLIQLKEGSIQTLQSKLKVTDEKYIAPSTNVTLLFFNEIEQLKNTIGTLSTRNRQLQSQNKSILAKNDQLTKKMNLLESLVLRSQLTYEEFKHYYHYDNKKTRSSAPKKGAYVPLEERLSMLAAKKISEIQTTRQCSEYSSLPKDNSLRMIIYKYTLEIEKLKSSLSKALESEKYQRKSKIMIAESYKQQQIKQHQMMLELNYYRKSTQDLVKVITYKREFLNSKSLQKSNEERLIDRIRVPKQVTYMTERKKYWTSVQSSIKIEKIKLLQVKRRYNHVYRSLSCLIDYKRLQVDEVDKYLNKRTSNKKQLPKKMTECAKDNVSDFSLMIQAPFEDDFSIIQSPTTKKSYSQWKKSSQKKNIFNLTVIEQNIL